MPSAYHTQLHPNHPCQPRPVSSSPLHSLFAAKREHNLFISSTCRSNRLQQLSPALLAADEVADPLVDALLGGITPQLDDHSVHVAPSEASTSHADQSLVGHDVLFHSASPLTPSSSISSALQPATQQPPQQQPQQLQPYTSGSNDWTFSPDESIMSAAESLPRMSSADVVGGFVGGRFTFASTAAGRNDNNSPSDAKTRTHVSSQALSGSKSAEEPHRQDAQLVTTTIEADLPQQQLQDILHNSTSISISGRSHQSLPDVGLNDRTAAFTEFNLPAEEEEYREQQVSAGGTFFSSRSTMLQQLQYQQLLLQRDHLLTKQRKTLYSYDISDMTGRIVRRAKAGPKHPLAQTSFALAKRQPAVTAAAAEVVENGLAPSDHQQAESSSSSNNSNSLSHRHQSSQHQQQQQTVTESQGSHHQPQQLQQQWMFSVLQISQQQDSDPGVVVNTTRTAADSTPLQQVDRSNRGNRNSSVSSNSSSSSSSSSHQVKITDRSDPADLSRGLCLSVFLYCCSQSKLLMLTWQLGLPPDCLKFVSRVADADVVLHVKPRAGEKHFHYDEYRKQAAEKGIPMVDLKSLSLQELQLYLLPVFKLYAGEVTPRDLLMRKKARGWKRRYPNIKLPPA